MYVWRGALSRCLQAMGVEVDLSKTKGPLRVITVNGKTVVADDQGRVLIHCTPAEPGLRTEVVGKSLAALIVQMANNETQSAEPDV